VALEQGAEERDRGAAAAPARRAEAGQDVGADNLFWMELGTKVFQPRDLRQQTVERDERHGLATKTTAWDAPAAIPPPAG